MATISRVVKTCDKGRDDKRCGKNAPFHHAFVLESGRVYGLDLCDQHEQQMLRAFEPWFASTYIKKG